MQTGAVNIDQQGGRVPVHVAASLWAIMTRTPIVAQWASVAGVAGGWDYCPGIFKSAQAVRVALVV